MRTGALRYNGHVRPVTPRLVICIDEFMARMFLLQMKASAPSVWSVRRQFSYTNSGRTA